MAALAAVVPSAFLPIRRTRAPYIWGPRRHRVPALHGDARPSLPGRSLGASTMVGTSDQNNAPKSANPGPKTYEVRIRACEYRLGPRPASDVHVDQHLARGR